MLFKILLVAALFGHGYDGATTFRALSCACGFREGNALIAWADGSPMGLVALKGGIAAGVTVGIVSLKAHHPKRAWVMLGAFAAAGFFSAEHNRRLYAQGHQP